MNKSAIVTDVLALFEKHASGLSPVEAQAFGKFLQDLLAFLIEVITTGGGSLGPEKFNLTKTLSLLGKTYTFTVNDDLTVTATSS